MNRSFRWLVRLLLVLAFVPFLPLASAQEKSVRPGINKPFQNPDVQEFIGTFETESREIFAERKKIVAACKLKPDMAVADIGAGTGLFTRLFAREVGPKGKVYAVDIAPKFIEHIQKTCKAADLKNVVGVVCTAESVKLPPQSVDVAFICDTYAGDLDRHALGTLGSRLTAQGNPHVSTETRWLALRLSTRRIRGHGERPRIFMAMPRRSESP